MYTHLAAVMAPMVFSMQGLITYLQGIFWPLFLGSYGIVAIFFLFTRKIVIFFQFSVFVVAISVIFYLSSILQTFAVVLPPGVFTWLRTMPANKSKRLSELVSSQLCHIAEPRTVCRMAPFAENGELLVQPGYTTGIRPQRQAKKISFITRQCEAALLQVVVAAEAIIRLVLLCLVQLRQITARQSIPVRWEALPPELRSFQPVMSGRSHGERPVRLDRTRQPWDETREVSFRPSKQQMVHLGN